MKESEKMTKAKMFIVLLMVAITSFGVGIALMLSGDEYSYDDSGDSSLSEGGDCNVLGINLHGDLFTYIPSGNESDLLANTDVVSSDDLLYYLGQAEGDENIKAVLVEVDSYGGVPVAGEEMADALKRFEKPSVAVVRQAGLSAAYYAISSADRIFASKYSDVGSIGVTSSYLENINKDARFIDLSSAKFKDAGDPNKALTAEERALFMRDIRIVHDNFVEAVSINRNIPIEKVKALADGSSVLGEKAKELGLIDEIGGIYEAKKYLSEKIGEKVEVCWY
ncbi:MAG: S49 family peptidase [Minisyncoccia bacterium]